MSQVKIKRNFRVISSVSITTATGTATTLRLEDMAGAVLLLPTITTNAATIQCWGCNTDTGTFGQLYGADGSAASITLAPSTVNQTMYAFPDAAYAVPYIKLVGANTNVIATATVVMKS